MNDKFIEYLAKQDVIKFGEFKYKSGRIGPNFFNLGAVRSGKSSYDVGEFFADEIAKRFGNDFDTVYGPAYKGIPLAISASIAFYKKTGAEKTWLFDRKEAKEHGDKGGFVGDGPRDGQKLVLVDDVITAGGTKMEAIAKLTAAAKVDIKGIVIAVDREEKGKERNAIREFEEATGIRIYPIERISNFYEHLHNRSVGGKIYINDANVAAFKEYQKQYGAKYE